MSLLYFSTFYLILILWRINSKNNKNSIREYFCHGSDFLNKDEIELFKIKIKYEGEYLNGKRNGKGKEYNYKGILKFEGEYLNGERNGKGKEYYSNGQLEFDGEYLNGKRWNGKGKEYNYDDEIEFEGEYLKGKKID